MGCWPLDVSGAESGSVRRRNRMYSSSVIATRAGLPTTTESGGTSFRTTAPAPTIDRGPIDTPGKINAPCPIPQSSCTTMRPDRVDLSYRPIFCRCQGVASCVMNVTSPEIDTLFPIVTMCGDAPNRGTPTQVKFSPTCNPRRLYCHNMPAAIPCRTARNALRSREIRAPSGIALPCHLLLRQLYEAEQPVPSPCTSPIPPVLPSDHGSRRSPASTTMAYYHGLPPARHVKLSAGMAPARLLALTPNAARAPSTRYQLSESTSSSTVARCRTGNARRVSTIKPARAPIAAKSYAE